LVDLLNNFGQKFNKNVTSSLKTPGLLFRYKNPAVVFTSQNTF